LLKDKEFREQKKVEQINKEQQRKEVSQRASGDNLCISIFLRR
jgi:hypothetical protein